MNLYVLGKTKTVLGMISALLYAKNLNKVDQNSSSSSTSTTSMNKSISNRLLVCAPSNGAVDELLSRLLSNGIVDAYGKTSKPKMVRLGKPLDGSPPSIDSLTLDTQIEDIVTKDPIYLEFDQSLKEYGEFQKQIKDFELNYLRADKEEVRKRMKIQLTKLKSKKINSEILLNQKRVLLRKEILESAQIVASTLSSSGQSLLVDHIVEHNITFDTVIVDEAGQSTEPATLIPLRYGCRRLVLVGDVRQLPAYVCSKEAEKAGLGVSLFERLEKAGHEIVMLTVITLIIIIIINK